jgi:hypothetical protein
MSSAEAPECGLIPEQKIGNKSKTITAFYQKSLGEIGIKDFLFYPERRRPK